MSSEFLQNHVIDINSENFQKTIETTKYLIVFFYTVNCNRCRDLNPEFWELAKRLTTIQPLVKIGRLECETNKDIADKYNIQSYPTIIFFRDGVSVDFRGLLETKDIVDWIRSKLNFPVSTLETIKDADNFIENHNVAIVGFFKNLNSNEARTYINVAFILHRGSFAVSCNEELMRKHEADYNSVIIFKKVEERKCFFRGKFDFAELMRFVKIYSKPLITECKKGMHLEAMIKANPVHLFLLVSDASGHTTKYVDPLRDVAKRFRDQVFFITTDPNEEGTEGFFQTFGLDFWEVPSMRLINWQSSSKGYAYKPTTNEITAESVTNFIKSYFKNEIPRYYPGEKLPYDWNDSYVLQLVTDNFDEVVFDASKTVVVNFYVPDAFSYQYGEYVYWTVAKKYYGSDVVLAQINVDLNDLKHADDIVVIPTIRMYKKGKKEISDFGLYPSIENLTLFIETGGEYGKVNADDYEKATQRTAFCYLHEK